MSTNPRPNLFIIGAPKCGTTAWTEYLGGRDDVFFSNPKEPHHFNTDMPGFRWYKTEQEYLELFSAAEGAKIRGEGSIMYLYSREAAANIRRFNPDAKILIFVRSHGSFVASYHQQLLYNRDEDETDLARAWAMSGHRPVESMPPHCREPRFVDYKSVGQFAQQAQRYLDLFPADQVRIIEFERWTKNPRNTYLEIIKFLGLEDDGMVDFPKINAAHRHKSAVLADLTQRPPSFVSTILRIVRKLPGLENLRPGRWLRKANRAEGYSTKPDTNLLQAIDTHYQADKDALRTLIEAQD